MRAHVGFVAKHLTLVASRVRRLATNVLLLVFFVMVLNKQLKVVYIII